MTKPSPWIPHWNLQFYNKNIPNRTDMTAAWSTLIKPGRHGSRSGGVQRIDAFSSRSGSTSFRLAVASSSGLVSALATRVYRCHSYERQTRPAFAHYRQVVGWTGVVGTERTIESDHTESVQCVPMKDGEKHWRKTRNR